MLNSVQCSTLSDAQQCQVLNSVECSTITYVQQCQILNRVTVFSVGCSKISNPHAVVSGYQSCPMLSSSPCSTMLKNISSIPK